MASNEPQTNQLPLEPAESDSTSAAPEQAGAQSEEMPKTARTKAKTATKRSSAKTTKAAKDSAKAVPKPRKRATQKKAASETPAEPVKKVRKPEPLNELVNSNRIIEVPTIELENGSSSSLDIPTIDTAQAEVEAQQAPAEAEAQPSKHVTDIDALFAEVSAEYEAAKAQEKAEVELKSEMVSDIEEPAISQTEAQEDAVFDDQGLFNEVPSPIVEDESNIIDFVPADGAFADTSEQDEYDEFASTDDADEDADEEAESPFAGAMDTVRAYANKGVDAVNEGISAVRNLSEAKHAHAEAREQLQDLEAQVADLSDQLAYRRDIVDNFDSILASQNAEIEAANTAFSEAADRQKTYEDQLVQGNAYLDKLKAANIKETAPYREIADAAKSTLEDAEQAYHNARSSLRIAKSQHRDALNSQDAQVSNAQRAADNAAARLAELQDAYAQMKRDPTTGTKELTDTNRNVAAALAQLETAKAKVAELTQATAGAVTSAQAQLDAQQELMDRAEAALAEAQRDERDKREQYEALRKNADADERDISSQLTEIEHKKNQANKDQETANKRIAAAQAAISEMKDIQAHPEITEDLAGQLASVQEALSTQQTEVDRLAAEEDSLTQTTQNVRIALVVAIAVLVIILILIIWLLFIR